jgi:DNA-directed RNA polymerase omega subunit
LANLELNAEEVGKINNPPKSRYSMVVLAAKRARQLKDGAPPLVEPTSTNLLTTALQEIAAGKIGIIEAAEEPDDEAPRYVRGGFMATDYDDMILEAENTPATDAADDAADGEESADDAEGTSESLNSVEE